MQAGSGFFVWLWDLGVWSLVSSLYAVNARSQRALGPASPPPTPATPSAPAAPAALPPGGRVRASVFRAVVEAAGLPLCLCCCRNGWPSAMPMLLLSALHLHLPGVHYLVQLSRI
jgi:hypothetical protein